MKTERHSEYLIKFGANLKSLRLKRNMSQEDLAYEAELSLSQVSRIERGVVSTSLSQIVSIAIALSIKPIDLFKFE